MIMKNLNFLNLRKKANSYTSKNSREDTGISEEDILESQARYKFVKAFKKKVIGKPCEGKPHARFDEGELEIGQPL